MMSLNVISGRGAFKDTFRVRKIENPCSYRGIFTVEAPYGTSTWFEDPSIEGTLYCLEQGSGGDVDVQYVLVSPDLTVGKSQGGSPSQMGIVEITRA